MSNITVNFVKEDDNNIYLSSIDENGIRTDYPDEEPLLTIGEDGTYSKVENVDLNKILEKTMEKPTIIDSNINNIDHNNEILKNPFEDGKTEELLEKEAAAKEAERLKLEEAAAKEAERLKLEEAAAKEAERLKLEEAAAKEAARIKAEEEAKVAEDFEREVESQAVIEAKEKLQKYKDIINELITNKDTNINRKKKLDALNNRINYVLSDKDVKPNDFITTVEAVEREINSQNDSNIENDNNNPFANGGKKNRTKKRTKAGKKKSKKVRFVMTKKGRKNKKNRTRR
jgi:hypothetical protein